MPRHRKREAAQAGSAAEGAEGAERGEGVAEDADWQAWGEAGSDQGEELCAVVKVSVAHAAQRYASPWKTSDQWNSVGSAFPIAGQRLLTNAHVVADARLIHVRRSDGHRKFVAEVVAMCYDCDLALVSVADSAFWEGLAPARFTGSLPYLQDEVTVVGFPDSPCGGEAICVTKGVVSRIDLHNYSWTSRLLVVQIDAAINPGNSGGPCTSEAGRVVGVAFQKASQAGQDNIGYLIPCPVVDRFLECCTARSWGFAGGGFSWDLIDNPSLRSFVGLPQGVCGVLVTMVEPTGPAHGVLEPAVDVLLSIDGVGIGEDGTVPLEGLQPRKEGSRRRQPLRVSAEWLLRQRTPGSRVTLRVLRRGAERDVELLLCRASCLELVPSDPLDGERLGTQPEYFLLAGLVFVPLTEPYLTEEYGNDWSGCPPRLECLCQHGRAEHPGHQIVLLSDVLACEFAQGYDAYVRLPVRRCDGQAVRNLAHLASLVAGCREAFVRLDLDDAHVIALRRDGIDEATQAVMKRNRIGEQSHIISRSSVPG